MDVTKITSLIKSKVKDVKVGIGEEKEIEVWYPTGVLAVDWIVGKGKGLPGGRVVEVYGDYGVGKSYFAYKVVAQAQRDGKAVLYVDAEESFSKELAERAGVDLDKLLVVSNVTVEEAFEVVKQVVTNVDGAVLVVWDSLAATPTEHELEEGMDTRDLTKAMAVGKGLRYVLADIAEKGGLLLMLNQIREKIGVAYGEVIFAPGGKAVGFHASVRMELKKVRKVVEGDRVVGFDVVVRTTKNRICEPFKEVQYQLRWDREDLIPWWEGLFDLLQKEGIVVGKGGWYSFKGDEKKWRADEFLVQLVENVNALGALSEFFGEDVVKRYLMV